MFVVDVSRYLKKNYHYGSKNIDDDFLLILNENMSYYNNIQYIGFDEKKNLVY
jgi:hypothetical protein